ncbi:MAG: hypothetical protein NVSMB49_20750 [Ktedonobacteraceae bacterium]
MTYAKTTTRMTPEAFEQWCRTRALPPATRDYLATIRGRLPVRRVSSRAGNVSGTYPSRKMGVTIQFESHKVELWAILAMDHELAPFSTLLANSSGSHVEPLKS